MSLSIRRSAPAILVTAILVVVAVLSAASGLLSHRMAASFEVDQFALMSQVLTATLKGAEQRAIASAEMMAAMPDVRHAFAARDRDALLEATRAAFAIQKEKYGISQAQFHLPPATSFLRVHNPPKHGEDQSNYRNIVLEVNRVGAIRKGIEITTSGIGIFGTLPMTNDAGAATGSFEMAYEFSPLLDNLKNDYGFELGFFVDEPMLRATATSLGGEVFNDQNRFGDHVSFYTTHAALMRSLVRGEDLVLSEEVRLVRESGGVPYGVLLKPVYNYAGKPIGVLAVARDFSALHSSDRQALVWQTLLGVLAALALSGAVLVTLRGLILRPLAVLSERIADASGGAASGPIEAPQAACDEIRELAERCEHLRSGREPAAPGKSK